MRKWIYIAAGLAAPGLWAQSSSSAISKEGSYWVETVTGGVSAVGVTRLRVSTEGGVVIRGAGEDRITYSLKKRVRAANARDARALLQDFEAKILRSQNDVRMTVVFPGQAVHSVDLTMQTPRTLRLAVAETKGGNVQVTGLDGQVEVGSGGGQIQLDQIGLNVIARTGGGEIHLGHIGGSARCRTGAGTIQALSVGGESWFETAGGDVIVQEDRGVVHASTAGGNIQIGRAAEVYAHTAGGVIDVGQAGGLVTADTSAGAIQVNSAKGVRCESSAGAIRLRNVDGPLRASTAAGNIMAQFLTGARVEDSLLRTNSGDITVVLSSNIPITVQARNESGGNVGKIVSDFPEIQVKTAAYGGGPVLAEGALNGGGPVLRIFVAGGTIYLRKQK